MIDMQHRTDLQFFADGAATAAGDPAAGVSAADAGQQTGASANIPAAPESEARQDWAEVREAYRAEFDAEVQSIVQRRLKGAQEKLRRYEERESATLAESEQSRLAAEAGERRRALAAAMRRSEAASHFSSLVGAADELRRRVPDFDLMRELESDAFAELTRPGSKVSLEQAYFALHPELRLREARLRRCITPGRLRRAAGKRSCRSSQSNSRTAGPTKAGWPGRKSTFRQSVTT